MKKILLLIIFLLTLTACNNVKEVPGLTENPLDPIQAVDDDKEIGNEVPVITPKEDPKVENIYFGTVSGFNHSVFYGLNSSSMLHDKYFDVEFTEIKYFPMKNEVCVSMSINDDSYQRATYHIVLRIHNSLTTRTRASFTLSQEKQNITECFNTIESGNEYEIVLGKLDRDDLNPTSYIEVVGGVVFSDDSYDSRERIGRIDVTQIDIPIIKIEHEPYVQLMIQIESTIGLINSIDLNIYTRNSFKYVKTVNVPISEDVYRNGKYILQKVLIEGLAPDCEYIVVLKGSGTDTVDEYTDQFLKKIYITAPTYFNAAQNSYHGLYAVFTSFEFTETDLVIGYLAKNDGSMVDSVDELPFVIMVNILDDSDTIVDSYALNMEANEIIVSKADLDFGYRISFETDRGPVMLSTYYFNENFLKPDIVINAFNKGELTYRVLNQFENISNLYIDIRSEDTIFISYDNLYYGIEGQTIVVDYDFGTITEARAYYRFSVSTIFGEREYSGSKSFKIYE